MDQTPRGMGAGMHPEMGAVHDYALGAGAELPAEWNYARGIGVVEREPVEPPVVPPVGPEKNPVVIHSIRSGVSIVGAYAAIAGLGLVASAMQGQFGHLTPTMLAMMMTFGPVIACACKDYLHFADSGEWNVTEPDGTPS